MSHHPFPWREPFLEALREWPVTSHACKVVGVNRSTVFRARQSNEAFAKEMDEAMEDGVDRAEQEAFRRAVVGVQKGVWHLGARVGEEQVYSDSLLALVLKGRRKQTYAERTELTGANGGPVTQQQLTVVTGVPLNPADQAPEDFA
jgi:hypothetical protein